MRSVALLSLLSIVGITSVVGCAASSDDSSSDNANGQAQDVTGGSGNVDAPVVYLFATADKSLQPSCAGAMLSDTMAVTVKACAKEGMIVGRATDDDGKGDARAQIKTIHAPPNANADIVVVELDRALEGTHAVITHTPLRDGYSVDGVAAADERGILSPLSPNKGGASSVSGTVISETSDNHASIVPAKGSTICASDIGAPVCSSTGLKIFNWNVTGTCGLSGLVVGPAANAAATPAVAGAPAAPPANASAKSCTADAWNVVELGPYADFLRSFAPDAFKPVVIDEPIIRNFPTAPDGLWGYKNKGDVTSCKIETTKLDPIPSKGSAKLSAKVMFQNMQERAAGYGRFGIAPKSAPANMRWLPAKATNAPTGPNNYELSFEGVVSADKDGDYVVAFRTSANGGETWQLCGTAGLEKGTTIELGLGLKIGTAAATTTTPTPTDPASTTTPKDAPVTTTDPSTDTGSYSDSPPADDLPESSSGDPTGDDDRSDPSALTPKKKKAAAGGCSAAPHGTSPASEGLPMLGLLLGLAAFVRRKRA